MAIINGTAGNDALNGTAGADEIYGLDGNDTLIGGAGADQLIGGAGVDTASYSTSGSPLSINLKTGVHTGDAAGDTYSGIEVIQGSTYGDSFSGDANGNKFDGGAGSDTINYALSPSAVNVNLTTAVVSGGDATGDTLLNIESVIGSSFNDNLAASDYRFLQGGQGNDVYTVGAANVQVVEAANEGDDEVQTALASLSLVNNVERLTYTGAGNFAATGNAGNNTLTGGNGNDTLIGGAGADQLIGGAGVDTASYSTSGSPLSINLKTGMHTGDAAGDTYNGIEVIQGSSYGDSFSGDANGNKFDGGAAIDTINYALSPSAVNVNLTTAVVSGGDATGDTLLNIESVIGSSFNDNLAASDYRFLQGGQGNDVYTVGAANVQVVEAANEGDDEVQTALASLSLANNVERLSYTGAANFTGTGNAGNNILTGGNGNDTLIGGSGADQLIGGAGVDTASYSTSGSPLSINLKTGVHTGDAAGDTYSGIEVIQGSSYGDSFTGDANANKFDGGAANDTINYALSPSAVNVNLTTAVVSGGDATGDTLLNIEGVIGSSFNDNLAASDYRILQGGQGNDVYTVGVANVQVVEAANEGDDEVQTALASLSLANNVERLSYTGAANFTGTGNAGNNILTGGNGNDTLIGGAGADQLIGGAGVDTASYSTSGSPLSINLKTGVHTGDAAGDTYSGIEVIQGSNYGDSFSGDANGNKFDGGAGSDTINYALSPSAVNVNLTTAVVSGGDATGDTLLNIEGVIGSSFNDNLAASDYRILQGGQGNDIYTVGVANVQVVEAANEGDDEVQTALASLSLANNVERLTYTGVGNFTATGNVGNNILTGGNGNDTLIGGGGADQLIGGAGVDTASYSTSGSPLSINLKTGMHTGDAAGDTYSGIEVIQGSSYGDSFSGDANGNKFDGGAGSDTINYALSPSAVNVNLTTAVVSGGDATGDILLNIEGVIGSSFNDNLAASDYRILQGGQGNDIYTVGVANVQVVEASNEGDDEVQTALASLSLANNVERLSYTGAGNFTGTGNGGNNILSGGNGNDTLIGGAGSDTLIGGAGVDTASYITATGVTINLKTGAHSGDASVDVFVDIEIFSGSNYGDTFFADSNANTFLGAAGNDTISYALSNDAVQVNLSTGVGKNGDAEGDVLSQIETVIGSAFDDTLIASDARTLQGGAGNDIYLLSAANISVVENANQGTDEVQTTLASLSLAQISSSANIERLLFTGIGNFAGTGNAADNTIIGGAGNDTLKGGAGADQLIGGAGFDIASYADSSAALVFNFDTGVFSGIANGDSLLEIEQIAGSNLDDVFIAGVAVHNLDGAGGIDVLSYSASPQGVSINLSSGVSTGYADGDQSSNIEMLQGSNYADSFVGNTAANVFIGAGGADTIDGGAGADTASYLGSNSAVQIDLLNQLVQGGDATGDVFISIENLTGSALDDTLSGDAQDNVLMGAAGNDAIFGGNGNDAIYGAATGGGALGPWSSGPQSDILYGGNGNDFMQTGSNDVGAIAYGESGADTISVWLGKAYGGDDNDSIAGYSATEIFGENGDDSLALYDGGIAYGGTGNDVYYANSTRMIAIREYALEGFDRVIFNLISTPQEMFAWRNGGDLYLTSVTDAQDGVLENGVVFPGWYNGGSNSIEAFITGNGSIYTLPIL